MNPNDRELIERLTSGDLAAFEEVVARWNSYVLNLAYRMIGEREGARDVRQEVFIRLFRSADTLDSQALLSTWLYRVTVNCCRDALRSRRSRMRALNAKTRETPLSTATSVCSGEQSEQSSLVARAVKSLPAPEREALVLRHYHDLTFAQVAEILDVPVTTIKSRVLRGLQRLAAELQDQGVSKIG